ncbi:MAG: dephospho-CoA kinase [Crocinitomicaceae bacterium]|nr:dephospho-CoA kinase [Flavobacteriales bacterium]NQZ34552.1 dephospho-CoA kinase [Crocinitomicaceae bacterium]
MTIGLTGGIGSGKSTVAKVLESMGYPVFYSDQVAKELIASDQGLQSEITSHFGESAFENGELNRAYLAERIFSNPADKTILNQLIHPRVRASFAAFDQSSDSKLVFNEAAIIFETGAYSNFDKTILVTAPVEMRIDRVMKRDNCSREDVQNRMDNQWSDDRKVPLSDFVIKNGDTDAVLDQIEIIVEALLDHSTSS